jgi:cytosine/adenosine deaminase-related metal-dependent hydrolase
MRGLAGGSALIGRSVLAASTEVAGASPGPSPSLPPRGEFIIRDAYVMTMEPTLGDIPGGSIHVRNGEIVAVGRDIKAQGAQVIDGQGTIVLPGLVETHWHMWNTLLRSMAIDRQRFGYFPTSAQLGAFYTPNDMYLGTRLAAAEAINAGITFVHDWCHNPRTPEHARENIRALAETGIRSRFSYGPARGIPVTQTLNLEDVARLHGEWDSHSNEGLLTLGLAWRGIQYAVTDADGGMRFQAIPPEVYRKEYDLARSLDIPITAHVNIGPKIDYGHVIAMQKLGLLYKDLQLVHMISSTPEEIDAVAESGASVSFSPLTEMRTGFGFARPADYLAKGIRVGLSVDTTTLSGDADMFDIMKVTENIVNGMAYSEFAMPARAALELGTIGGARSMGMDDRIGSLAVGKRADVIMVDTRGVNIGMFTDPANMIIGAAQPADVSLVMVDGRILKQNGKLTSVDVARVTADAASANAALRKRGGWW